MQERARWDDYMTAYDTCLSATSSKAAPWFVVPADDKQNCRLIVSQIILHAMRGLAMRYPVTSPERRQQLLAIRTQLEASAWAG